MNVTQLKVFHAIARHGSFSAAAATLSLTQPAVSDHIRKLEQTYGVSLFVRGRKGASLTDTGRKLLAATERLSEAEADAEAVLSRARLLQEGEFTIGADAAVHIMDALGAFCARYPRINVRLVTGNSADLINRLRKLEIDVAVAAEEPSGSDVTAIRLRQDRMVALVERKSPLAARRSVALRALMDFPIILREQGSATREITMKSFEAAGLVPPLTLQMQGREAIVEAVARKMGVALISDREVPQDRRVAALRLSDCHKTMSEWLLYLRARSDLRLMQAFLAVVKEVSLHGT